jgi:hypothetical protein
MSTRQSIRLDGSGGRAGPHQEPAGTWIRSPHLSQHHPFVDRETVIWVKTGHLG